MFGLLIIVLVVGIKGVGSEARALNSVFRALLWVMSPLKYPAPLLFSQNFRFSLKNAGRLKYPAPTFSDFFWPRGGGTWSETY